MEHPRCHLQIFFLLWNDLVFDTVDVRQDQVFVLRLDGLSLSGCKSTALTALNKYRVVIWIYFSLLTLELRGVAPEVGVLPRAGFRIYVREELLVQADVGISVLEGPLLGENGEALLQGACFDVHVLCDDSLKSWVILDSALL